MRLKDARRILEKWKKEDFFKEAHPTDSCWLSQDFSVELMNPEVALEKKLKIFQIQALVKSALTMADSQVATNIYAAATIDSLISKLGGEWTIQSWLETLDNSAKNQFFIDQKEEEEEEEAEERKKDTSEVSEVSDNPSDQAEKHGGDGNSAEVEHAAEKKSEKDRDGASSEKKGQKSEEKKEQPGTDGSNGSKESEGTSGEKKSKSGGKSGDGSESDKDSETGKKKEKKISQKKNLPPRKGGRKGGSTSSGSYYDEEMAFARAAKEPMTKEVKEIEKAILKFFLKNGIENGNSVTTPLVDGKKLVKEIVSKRFDLSKTRKAGLERKPKWRLLLADVSGSCSAAAQETLEACVRIANKDPLKRTLVIIHINGGPYRLYGHLPHGIKPIDKFYFGSDHEETMSWWKHLFSVVEEIDGAIAFGDWDAKTVILYLAQNTSFAMLDSYDAQHGPRKGSKEYQESAAKVIGKTKYKNYFWVGVNDVKSAAFALRQISKTG
jgi:hypothetical protein